MREGEKERRREGEKERRGEGDKERRREGARCSRVGLLVPLCAPGSHTIGLLEMRCNCLGVGLLEMKNGCGRLLLIGCRAKQVRCVKQRQAKEVPSY